MVSVALRRLRVQGLGRSSLVQPTRFRTAARPFSTITSASDQPDIVVVGGGCAGLACAIGLAETKINSKPLRVHLIEADSRLGGRARSWPDAETGHPLHIGPHVVYSDYPNYFKLLRMLGTEKQVVWQKDKSVFVTINGYKEDSGATKSQDDFISWPVKLWNSLPPPLNWLPTVLKDPFVSWKDTLSLVPFGAFVLQIKENGELIKKLKLSKKNQKTNCDSADDDLHTWQQLDKISGDELMNRFGVSDRYKQHILAFCSNAILNVPLNEVSGASLVSFFRRLIGRPNVALGFIDGGLGTVLEPAEGYLTKKGGCEVLLNTMLKKLDVNKETGAVSVEIESSDGSVQLLRPKHGVVLTLPALETLQFLPPEVRDSSARVLSGIPTKGLPLDISKRQEFSVQNTLSRFQPCKYVSVYLWFDKDIRALDGESVSDTTESGRQFWAKKYHPSDLCCEFYDFKRIYSKDGPAGVVAEPGAGSSLGVNMIDTDRLDTTKDSETPPCSSTGILSTPNAREFAAKSWTDQQLVDKAIQELHESVPSAKNAKLVRSVVHRIPMAIPRPVVGTEMSRPMAGLISPENNKLFYAGDWCQTSFPASMETATQAGFACADEVVQTINGDYEAEASKAWQETHPCISELARLPSRWIAWPVVRRLFSSRLRGIDELVGK